MQFLFFFDQPLGNLFLTIKAMFNWNFQSIATFTVQPSAAEYLRKECSNLNEVPADNDDVKEDDYANSEDVEVAEIGTGEILTMLEQVSQPEIPIKGRNSLLNICNGFQNFF